MGFQQQWINWVMACVCSMKYAVNFNRNLLDAFTPTRGLRQGDPLSPYLFLIVAEDLSCVIKEAIITKDLEEFKICRTALGISHLLFADDSLLFFRASEHQAVIIRDAIKIFERASGQQVSKQKCALLFGPHCSEVVQENIMSILRTVHASFDDKYLGLPVPEGRMKCGRFQGTMEKLGKRLSGWTNRHLSVGGKEVLIKSVAQAFPTYVMGVFKLSAEFCEEYMKLIRNFWWGDEPDKRKVDWIAWEKMMMPKFMGGLGFRDMKLFNQALLARQAWRLILFPNSLCARLLKTRYYPNGDLVDTILKSDSSPSWKGIEHGLDLLKQGLIW